MFGDNVEKDSDKTGFLKQNSGRRKWDTILKMPC